MYMYMYMCSVLCEIFYLPNAFISCSLHECVHGVCVCVCEREREREHVRKAG